MANEEARALRVRGLYPTFSSGRATTHVCLSLARHLRGPEMEVEFMFVASAGEGRSEFTIDAVPRWLKGVAYRLDPSGRRIQKFAEGRFSRRLRAGDIAYLWPGTSTSVYRQARERGAMVVNERINCHRATSKRILDDAYRRLGRPPQHQITDEAIREETEKLLLCDYVFAPSPLVAQSLKDAGLPETKILQSSYGWDPQRLNRGGEGLEKGEGITALFVGRSCVRKGVDLLAAAWAKADIRGRLFLVGQMDAELEEICSGPFRRADIVRRSYMADIAAIYRSADLFIFPTLEEGSPLVLYEAMASGLACILSPMAAGEIGRPGVDCLVVDPQDQDGWIASIRRLAGDEALRKSLGEQARLRAQDFTWEKVAGRRRELLLKAYRGRATERRWVPEAAVPERSGGGAPPSPAPQVDARSEKRP
jgi:glycosyltransferase involved in cell wall biosynthesis